MPYMIILGYSFSPQWLALDRAERRRLKDAHIGPIAARYADRVRMRFFDAEAFQTQFSDFALLETEDLQAYYFLVEELRDTPLISQGYLTIKDIFLGVEDGHQAYERILAGAGS
ncbi:darcynin family protein [Streptomyces bugieae]|uniref:Darcynin family protein n=1 Tax=Streptomyces bugieae TaxID=3098223 RepID=A0ABU7NP00_9ACTN|nr:darcynin family protein [Streptomyces sp. DSM 41528]